MTKPLSPILQDIYNAVLELYKGGVISREKLREWYELVYENHLNDEKLDALCNKLLRDRK